MRAVHLPPLVASDDRPRFSFPSSAPTPSDLRFSHNYPTPTWAPRSKPAGCKAGAVTDSTYLLQVLTTSPTRHELTWRETLLPERFTTTKGPIPCHNVVGRVVAVTNGKSPFTNEDLAEAPSGSSRFDIGDIVFGLIDFDRDGAATEYTVVKESEIARVPSIPAKWQGGHVEWEEMLATIPLSALTAWQALFDYGGLKAPVISAPTSHTADSDTTVNDINAGSTPVLRTKNAINVLITGAAGGVGLLAVQLANIARQFQEGMSVTITAICSKRHADLMTQLGADKVVVYDAAVFSSNRLNNLLESEGTYDLILDLTGPPLLHEILHHHQTSSQPLAPTAKKVVSIAAPLNPSALGFPHLGAEALAKLQARFKFFIVKPDSEQLEEIGALVGAGQLRGFVDEVFPLEGGVDAMEGCERRNRQGAGKVVIRVASLE